MQDADDAMPVSVLVPQKLKPNITHSRRHLSKAYPLKTDGVERNCF